MQRLIDPDSGQKVQLVYALPSELIQGTESGADEGGISLNEIAGRLWHGKWIILIAAMLGGLLGAGYALRLPDVYTAEVTALPPSNAGRQGGIAHMGLAAPAIMVPSGPSGSVDEITAILDSRRLAEPLVQQFELWRHYFPGAIEPPPQEAVIAAFRQNFHSSHSAKTNRITFGFTHPDPGIALSVVRSAAEKLSQTFNGIHQSEAKRRVRFLEERLVKAEADLSEATARLVNFQHETGVVELETQTKATIEAIATIQGQSIVEQVELQALLASHAGGNNPRIKMLQERIKAAQGEMQRLLGTGPAQDGVLFSLGRLPDIGVGYLSALRGVRQQEAVLAGINVQLESARVMELISAEAITIIDEGSVPEQKSGPSRTRYAFSGALALAAGMGMLLLVLRQPKRAESRPEHLSSFWV